MLGLRETAQAQGLGADLAAHPLPLAGRAEGAHGFEHRIKQAEEEQAQVTGILGVALGIAPGRVELGGGGREQTRAEAGPQIPWVEIFLGQGQRVVGPTSRSAEGP